MLVHGASATRAQPRVDQLHGDGVKVLTLSCACEPTVQMLEAAIAKARAFGALWVAALGGGAVHDLGKALAAMVPGPAAHGAICSALLGPVIAINRAGTTGQSADRLAEVSQILARAFECRSEASKGSTPTTANSTIAGSKGNQARLS